MREGEERLNSGKDIPTFIPRTYLWSRRDSTPPKLVVPLEGVGGDFRKGAGLGGDFSAIAEEWRRLENSQQKTLASRERKVKHGKDTTQMLLNARCKVFT